MAKSPKKPKPEDIETKPGARGRFEDAVDAAVKSGPKHRVTSKSHKPTEKGKRGPEPQGRKLKRKGVKS